MHDTCLPRHDSSACLTTASTGRQPSSVALSAVLASIRLTHAPTHPPASGAAPCPSSPPLPSWRGAARPVCPAGPYAWPRPWPCWSGRRLGPSGHSAAPCGQAGGREARKRASTGAQPARVSRCGWMPERRPCFSSTSMYVCMCVCVCVCVCVCMCVCWEPPEVTHPISVCVAVPAPQPSPPPLPHRAYSSCSPL